MKYWRRHKHELNRSENDEPIPEPPDKKMRYSREDDILLAKFFLTKPEGTSDKIFQHFGRLVSLVSQALRVVSFLYTPSTPTILGKGGRSITVFIKPKLNSSWS